jgi:hypothetical protein
VSQETNEVPTPIPSGQIPNGGAASGGSWLSHELLEELRDEMRRDVDALIELSQRLQADSPTRSTIIKQCYETAAGRVSDRYENIVLRLTRHVEGRWEPGIRNQYREN